MIHKSIESYIQYLRSRNISDKVIEENLLRAGWSIQDIRQGLSIGVSVENSIPPAPPGQFKNNSDFFGNISMWDSFQHILLFISMYVLAITIVLTFMLYIDKWLPGIPTDQYQDTNIGYQLSMLRSYMASFNCFFPFVLTFFL